MHERACIYEKHVLNNTYAFGMTLNINSINIADEI